MLIRLRLATTLAALAFMQVASAAPKTDPLDGIHSVAVVSTIGEKIALQNTGLMAFGNSYDILSGDALKIDDEVVTQVAHALPATVAVKPVAVDRGAFSTQATSWFNESEVDVESLVSKLSDRESVDAYIVVYPAPIQDIVFQTNQYLRGLGVYRRAGLGSASLIAYAMYRVAVVDAHTGKIVAREWPTNGKTGFFDMKLPFAPVSITAWSETTAGLSEPQKQEIRSALLALVTPSLAGALTRLGLPSAQAPKGD